MDIEPSTIMAFIDSTGFPIAISCGLFWLVNTTLKGVRTTLENLNKTVENNTAVINSLKKDKADSDV